MKHVSTAVRGAVVAFAAVSILGSAIAQPPSPVYYNTFSDAVTGDNAFMFQGSRYWDVDPGSDSYQNDYYERPTIQGYQNRGGRYSTHEYFEYLDIVEAKFGFDSDWMYVSIRMYGRNKSTSDGNNSVVGLVERYGFGMSMHPDGRNGLLLISDQTELKNPGVFGREANFGWRDTDGDVGGRGLMNGGPTGRTVTKSDNPLEEAGMNGYNQNIISDGRVGSTDVLLSRTNPTDNRVVEFAFRYSAFGFSMADLGNLRYLNFEANKGTKDPQNYLWNDKYRNTEAGSPNPGAGGFNEFGTNGLGNIYELDTLHAVPEPTSMAAIGMGLAALAARRRKNRK